MITWFSSKKKTISHRAKKGGDDFTSISSHELRSPLSVIKWYTEILLDEDAGALNDDQKKYLRLIESSNQRAIDLIRALLNVSRLDLDTFSISPEEVTLKDLIIECSSFFKGLSDEKKVAINTENLSISDKILIDKNVSSLVIKSLIKNAIAFSHEGGVVTLGLSHVRAGNKFLDVTLLDESIVFSVVDTGIGIPAGEHSKIATKMYRAGNVGDIQGAGLSLYIVKTVMEKVNGKFGFTSNSASGSTFFVAFPVRGMVPKKGRTTLE